ncbi:MAG: hypothetical protein AB7D42_02525 [Candidatus Methanomethylophilaceae archaeon]|nr:hypothetical protein [Candidatus Methanomethylophilaceae archaeon]
MIIAGRNRDYKELSESLSRKRVLVLACNTCVKLCGGLGGADAAERLSDKLSKDGIDVTGTMVVSASCIGSRVREKFDPEMLASFDVILSLTCPLGASCVAAVSGKDICNPVETIGIGYLDEDGTPIVVSGSCDYPEEEPAFEAAKEAGLKMSPFV